jgi:hypothetical protein
MQAKSDTAAAAVYTIGVAGVAAGQWLADHWLQVANIVLILIAMGMQRHFGRLREAREVRRETREQELHALAMGKTTEPVTGVPEGL